MVVVQVRGIPCGECNGQSPTDANHGEASEEGDTFSAAKRPSNNGMKLTSRAVPDGRASQLIPVLSRPSEASSRDGWHLRLKSHRLSRRLRGGWWRCGARLKLACGWNGGLHEAKQPRSGDSADDKRRASLTLSSGILVQTAWVHRICFTRLVRTGCHGACVVGRQEAKQGASQLPVARRAFASREAGSL